MTRRPLGSRWLLVAAVVVLLLDRALGWAFARAVGDGSALLTPSGPPDALLLALGAASLGVRVAARVLAPALLAAFVVTEVARRWRCNARLGGG